MKKSDAIIRMLKEQLENLRNEMETEIPKLKRENQNLKQQVSTLQTQNQTSGENIDDMIYDKEQIEKKYKSLQSEFDKLLFDKNQL